MSLPPPEPGLVICYSYLWADEARAGREEGVKDRPCVVVLAVEEDADETYVLVAPITHTPPRNAGDAIELPPPVKQHLGLDTERSWIVYAEGNRFPWPGPDLRLVPGSDPPTFSYGMLPRKLFRVVRDRMIGRIRERLFGNVKRTE